MANTVVATPSAGSRPQSRRLRRKLPLYLFLVPTFVFLIAFSYYPSLSAVYYSFTYWDGFNPPRWIGLDNYARMVTDEAIRVGITNIILLTIGSLVTRLTFPLIAAEAIYHLRSQRWQYWYRVLFVVPMVVPSITILMIWRFIFDPQVGLLNTLFRNGGLSALANPWLGSYTMALPSLVIIGFPWISGISFLIYLAGLQSIPGEVIDAAAVDGAMGFRRVWLIDLPLITAEIKLLLILGIIEQIQQFVTVLILTNGGPGLSTMVPGLVMYQRAFADGDFGYGTAIGLAMCIVILILTYLNLKYIRSSTEYEPGK